MSFFKLQIIIFYKNKVQKKISQTYFLRKVLIDYLTETTMRTAAADSPVKVLVRTTSSEKRLVPFVRETWNKDNKNEFMSCKL